MTSLYGKVAVVTGASKGIGAGIAKSLGASGASVVVNYASSCSYAEQVVEEIRVGGGRALAVQADISKPDQVKNLFQEAVTSFGKLNVLVNNAGIFEFGPLEAISEDSYRRVYATNVWGPILSSQQALAYFADEGGSIINISSGVTRMLSAGASLYAGSKGALDLITIVLSKELGPRRIRVNAISPGATDTEGAHAVGAMSDEAKHQYSSMTPLGRVGQPQDIGRLAVFLASDEASWITGEIIHASGGLR